MRNGTKLTRDYIKRLSQLKESMDQGTALSKKNNSRMCLVSKPIEAQVRSPLTIKRRSLRTKSLSKLGNK
jgi:hypothetical protein